MNSIINWLNRPYPLERSAKYKVSISAFFGIFVFFFIYIYQPFRIQTVENNLFLYSLGFGIITFLVSLISYFSVTYFFKPFKNKWTFANHLVSTIITLFIIIIIAWFYNSLVHISKEGPSKFTTMATYCLSVAIIPVSIFLFIDEKKARSKIETIAKEQTKKIKKNPIKKGFNVLIKSEETKESISIELNRLVYITSEGNYASFFIDSDTGLKEILIRKTLSKIEKELAAFENIIRCHKSYIVNTNFIDSFKGNTKGYLLSSKKIPFDIPISRKFKKDDLKAFIEE